MRTDEEVLKRIITTEEEIERYEQELKEARTDVRRLRNELGKSLYEDGHGKNNKKLILFEGKHYAICGVGQTMYAKTDPTYTIQMEELSI